MTAYAVISDVHANLEALHAVLEKLEKANVDRILFLGDSVGYGPNPNECTEELKDRSAVFIAGNHDWAAVGKNDSASFNIHAKTAIDWTRELLTAENREYLAARPLTAELEEDDIFLVHGSPYEPQKWHYLYSEYDTVDNFSHFKEKICFVGHSHVPFIAEYPGRGTVSFHDNITKIKTDCRYIVNAGSIGQPRDGNPEAAYVILRDRAIEIKRTSYDIVLTQNKMKKAGLPSYLIDRLSEGR
ncbi:MAG: metallophosphoesterase family protein [Nitrospirota bacterium]